MRVCGVAIDNLFDSAFALLRSTNEIRWPSFRVIQKLRRFSAEGDLSQGAAKNRGSNQWGRGGGTIDRSTPALGRMNQILAVSVLL